MRFTVSEKYYGYIFKCFHTIQDPLKWQQSMAVPFPNREAWPG